MEKTSVLFNKSNYNFTASAESHKLIANEIIELSNTLSSQSKKADEKLL